MPARRYRADKTLYIVIIINMFLYYCVKSNINSRMLCWYFGLSIRKFTKGFYDLVCFNMIMNMIVIIIIIISVLFACGKKVSVKF